MPIPPKKLSALVRQQKKSPVKKAMPKDHDEDDDYGGGSTDMSKMHPPKKGKHGDDEKTESTPSHDEGSKSGASHEGTPPPHEKSDPGEESHPGGDEHGGSHEGSHPPEHGGEGSDPGSNPGEHEHGGDDGQQGGGKEQWIAMLNDNIDVLQQIVEEIGDLPTENPGDLSPEKKQEIDEEVGRMPHQLQGGFKKFAKNISWEEAQDVASKAGADDPEKLGAWIYFAGRT